MLEVLHKDYIRTARAKGLTEALVVGKHALRNALIPVVTIMGLQIGFMLGGSVVTEYVFAWPGMGTLLVTSITTRDYPLLQGVVVYAVSFVLINLTVDILYTILDPEMR